MGGVHGEGGGGGGGGGGGVGEGGGGEGGGGGGGGEGVELDPADLLEAASKVAASAPVTEARRASGWHKLGP